MSKLTEHQKCYQIFSLGLLIALGVIAPMSGHAQQFKMPYAAECILLQNKSAALWAKGLPPEAAAEVAKATEEEMKTYRNGQVKHDPTVLKAEILRLLIELEKPGLFNQTRDSHQQALASADAALCWQDYAARRNHTFPTSERMQFLADQPDDPKTFGGGARWLI